MYTTIMQFIAKLIISGPNLHFTNEMVISGLHKDV